MPDKFDALLTAAPILTDGAWGTQLQQRGLPIGACPDAWNLTHPDEVEAVARAYVDAGSRVILTNTFGASRITLDRHGLGDRSREVNRLGATLSRNAVAGTEVAVFASVGPTGKLLAAGEVTEDDVLTAYLDQMAGLAEGGVDAVVIETMSDLAEATLALRAAQDAGLPAVVSMVFDAGRQKDRTMMGVRVEEAATALTDAGASAVGLNCGVGPDTMTPLVRRFREATSLPLWVKPNAGLPQLVDGAAIYTVTPQAFAQSALELVDAGATFIGGCCGSGPEFISSLNEALKARAA